MPDKLFIRLKCRLQAVDGANGQKYWKLSTNEHAYEFQSKALVKFENLINGDQERGRL